MLFDEFAMAASFLSVHDYPLPSRHVGAPLGNAYLGLYAWGGGRTLSVTIGCGALWDHRGGIPNWSPKANYKNILHCLQTQDKVGLDAIFPKMPFYWGYREILPTIVPVGRIDLTLPEGDRLLRNELDRSQALLRVVYGASNVEKCIEIRLDMAHKGLFAIRCQEALDLSLLPAYECCCLDVKGEFEPMAREGYERPLRINHDDFQAFVQPMPADPAYGVAIRSWGFLHTILYRQGLPAQELLESLEPLQTVDWQGLSEDNIRWWKTFWEKVPAVDTGDDDLDEIYLDGLYKFASMTEEHGVPAGLQGPWIEDCGFPPWSSDYHLNINLEMCYWPAFRAGLFGNLRPALDMVWSWRDKLRHIAKCYVGIDDGYMLPHSVDDRCTCMGNFWTGAVDHACTAWMAQLMFDYCDYSGDMDYLRQVAFPFMKGAMNVYLAQMETEDDGKLSLPLTTSPEYGADDFDAWGKNASFQLAACHRLNRNLLQAAELLGEAPDCRWIDVEERLPQACVEVDGERKVFALWKGQILEESHRHHSHLASIVPFDTIDYKNPAWQEVIDGSYEQWIQRGMGEWTGWCLPWAAMLNTHLDKPVAALQILKLWKRYFTNQGGGSTHDAQAEGLSIYCHRRNIMQMDGAMGALTAIQDCFLHSRNGVLHLFAGIPMDAPATTFHNMRAPGGFLVSGKRERHSTQVTVTATRDHILRMVCHCGPKIHTIDKCQGAGLPDGTRLASGQEFTRMMTAGESVTLLFY